MPIMLYTWHSGCEQAGILGILLYTTGAQYMIATYRKCSMYAGGLHRCLIPALCMQQVLFTCYTQQVLDTCLYTDRAYLLCTEVLNFCFPYTAH